MPFKFAQVEKEKHNKLLDEKWKILIVDDEEDIHNITKLALKKFVFEKKKIEFFDAYNGAEAIELLKQHKDIDLLLLDVVMDSDDDGLRVVKKVREELHNHTIRIVLRTGQPGHAPEHEVIMNYDIDDYKEKTELTSTKLFTTVVGALRTSRHLKDIEKNKEGLKHIIEASKSIFHLSSLLHFTQGVLTQLGTILNLNTSLYEYRESNNTKEGDCFFATLQNSYFQTLSASGKFKDKTNGDVMTPKALEYLNKAYLHKKSFFDEDIYVGYFHSAELDRLIFLYIEGCSHLDENDKQFLEVFSNNISISFENICLMDNAKLKDAVISQQSKMATMGEMIDNIAHQWKQPLSVITTSASGIQMEKEHEILTDEGLYQYCDAIIKTSEFLSHTIDDFRSFFKNDKKKSYFKIKDIIHKALFLLSAKLKKNYIEIKEDIEDFEIHGFPNGFIQGVLNIINNAIDAHEEHDTKQKRVIWIEGKKDNDSFSLSIKDNAGGIPLNVMENIFNQYFTTKEHKNGTGVGLYMAKNIIKEHFGGTISVSNTEFEHERENYKGALFVINAKIKTSS